MHCSGLIPGQRIKIPQVMCHVANNKQKTQLTFHVSATYLTQYKLASVSVPVFLVSYTHVIGIMTQ